MLDQEKVFEKMHGLLGLHDQMSLSTFTSMSIAFLCATLQALEHAPPMVRLHVSRSVTQFIDEITRDGGESQQAWKILDQLGVSLQTTADVHDAYVNEARN